MSSVLWFIIHKSTHDYRWKVQYCQSFFFFLLLQCNAWWKLNPKTHFQFGVKHKVIFYWTLLSKIIKRLRQRTLQLQISLLQLHTESRDLIPSPAKTLDGSRERHNWLAAPRAEGGLGGGCGSTFTRRALIALVKVTVPDIETLWLGEAISFSNIPDPPGPLSDGAVAVASMAIRIIGLDRGQLATKLGEKGKNLKQMIPVSGKRTCQVMWCCSWGQRFVTLQLHGIEVSLLSHHWEDLLLNRGGSQLRERTHHTHIHQDTLSEQRDSQKRPSSRIIQVKIGLK